MEKIKVINGGLAVDERGSVRFVNDFTFEGVKRFYQVENNNIGFIRAWHGHMKESKYLYVASGSALVGMVNLKNEEVNKVILSWQTPKVLYIPAGHANGFMNLEKNTKIFFFSTSSLEDSLDDDIRYDYKKWDIWEIENK